MRLVTINNTAHEIGTSPFFTGGEAVFFNPGEDSATVQGSPDGEGDWTTLATVPGADMVWVDELPAFVRVSTSANIRMLGG